MFRGGYCLVETKKTGKREKKKKKEQERKIVEKESKVRDKTRY